MPLQAGELALPGRELFLLATDGKAKRIRLDEFPQQGRYGQGVVAWKLAHSVQLAGAFSGRTGRKATINFEKAAGIQIRLGDAALGSRATAGKRLVDVAPGDRLIGMTIAGEALTIADDESSDETKVTRPGREAETIARLKPRSSTNGRKKATEPLAGQPAAAGVKAGSKAIPSAKVKKAAEPAAGEPSIRKGAAAHAASPPAKGKKAPEPCGKTTFITA